MAKYVAQGHVQRDMGNRQARARQKHGKILDTGLLRQNLRVPRIVQSRGPQSFFVNRGSDDACRLALQSPVNGGDEVVVSGPASSSADLSGLHIGQVLIAAVDASD